MGTVLGGPGGGVLGGPGGGGTATPVLLLDILNDALRVAGIKRLPGGSAGEDSLTELIRVLNRMMSSYSLDGHRIFNSRIDQLALTSGQKVYTIGPGAQFDIPRPIYIPAATLIFPTTPQVRWPIKVTLDESVWMSLAVQDVPGAPPGLLYYDESLDENGWARIYLYYQPPDGYILELASWSQLRNDFVSSSDSTLLPPGYEEMMVWNLGIRAASMYPVESKMAPDAREMARAALQNVITLNSKSPALQTEAGLNRSCYDGPIGYGWLTGPFEGH